MPWHPRMWHGMTMRAWFPMMARQRFAVSPSRAIMAVIISMISPLNSALALSQKLVWGKKIRDAKIEPDPIFIVGHWRSGTTLLHELLVQDRQFTYPNTYACFTPEHFLFSRYLIPWWLKFIMPSRRPMDNMEVSWERPQEDEFALCALGLPSPYLSFAFPNIPHLDDAYFDLRGLPPADLQRWKTAFVQFLKCVSVAGQGRQIVLKTPLHTARIDTLRELFPNAKFVHIVRDPYVIFPSTVRTWQRMSEDEGFQRPKNEGLEEMILSRFTRMYEVFEDSRTRIPPDNFCEVRYENLIDDPVAQLRKVYDRLGLDGFECVLPALEERAAGMRGFKVNRHKLSDEMRDQITERWGDFISRYQYWGSGD
ncbi:MAG: sulfotransferase [Planctomycetaceae bacterium]|nr:sulfotransferase [Planctomycetaceae bacterium]